MDKPIYEMPDETSPEGNVFLIIGSVSDTLKLARFSPSVANEFRNKAYGCGSYEEVKELVEDYCEVV